MVRAMAGPAAKRTRRRGRKGVAIGQFAPLPVLSCLLRRYPVAPAYAARARSRRLFSAALEPLRWYEQLRFGRQLRRVRVHPQPLFLLGYGRSGTTHLHNLLWKDTRFGVLTSYQASLHPIALLGRGWLERRLAGLLPKRRPMDNVALSLDSPQEEEIALMNSTEHTPLRFMDFPQELPEIYDRYVVDLGKDPAILGAWKDAYSDVLRKATFLCDGKPLVLKTPPNTARIPVLVEMFPDARFVHLVRNPYRVYQSMRNMYRKVLPGQVMQELDWDAIDAWTLEAYRSTMGRYLDTRDSLAPGRLFEARYEDLDRCPLEVLEQLYEALELPDFEAARPAITKYLEELGTFEKNRFDFPPDVVEAVNEHWGFALDAFGYEKLEPGESPEGREPATRAEPSTDR
jgi:hypothetical protein